MKTYILASVFTLLSIYILPSFISNPHQIGFTNLISINSYKEKVNKKDCDVTIIKRYNSMHITIKVTCTAIAADCDEALEKAVDCADKELARLMKLLKL